MPLKLQYALTFAVLGCLQPFVPLYLADEGLSKTRIGYVLAATSFAIALSPVIVTLLADTHVQPRRLMLLLNLGAAAALVGFAGADGFWPLLLFYALYSLIFAPAMPLQDGITFSVQQDRRRAGLSELVFHKVRAWGSAGFILPSLLLYAVLAGDNDVGPILPLAIGVATLGALNTLALPKATRELPSTQLIAEPQPRPLPTLAAARVLLEPHALVFCAAMLLVFLAAAAYYGYYPIYLRDHAGVPPKWIGPITQVGVLVEVFFMLAYGRIERRLGLRGLLLLGLGAMAVRMALLAWSASPLVAIGTQAFHGIMAIVMHVAPAEFLNRRAGDAYRNSIQGLFAMAVAGSGRIAGNFIAGYVAEVSLAWLFAYASALCALAAALILFAFHGRLNSADRYSR